MSPSADIAAAVEDAREALRRCRDGAEIALGEDVSPHRARQVLRAIWDAAVAVVGER